MQALQWVRSRHLQMFENGQWVDASPRGDLDRIARQQTFVRALVQKARAELGGDPAAAVRFVDALIPSLTVDSAFSRAEILGLVRVLAQLDPADLNLATLPVQPSPDGAHLVMRQSDTPHAELAPFQGEPGPVTEPPPPPEC